MVGGMVGGSTGDTVSGSSCTVGSVVSIKLLTDAGAAAATGAGAAATGAGTGAGAAATGAGAAATT